MSAARPGFRPDIEGLRGVAILLVVLFHARVPAFAGGFVGVDVFFVLSGFFITGLLVREAERAGNVSLTVFYGRRALRLVPALLVVLVATLAAVMTLYAPIDRADIARTARSVALYAGNLEFARTAVNYFSAGENPLLHTWSLAVEEQFYFVWPLLFLLAAALSARRAMEPDPDESRDRSLLLVMCTAGLLSFVVSLWLTRTAQPWAFFGMPARLWEFALGGALFVAAPAAAQQRGSLSVAIQLAGLAAIVFAVAAYDRATPYPGLAALLPALGACALLIGGESSPQGPVSRLLGSAPLRALGRLSYAWYLWHWPLTLLVAVLHPTIGVGGRLAWSAFALLPAWLTYRLVERPAREGRLSRMPVEWIAPAALVASVAVALLAHVAMRSAERGVAHGEQRTFAAAREDRMHHRCWATTVDDPRGACEFGDVGSPVVIALLGDSHAEHWLGALDRAGRERGWKIVAMVKGGCPVSDVPDRADARLGRHYRECTRYRDAMLRRIETMQPAAVILSSWDHYIPAQGPSEGWQHTPASWRDGLRRTYARLSAAGLSPIVMRDVPRVPFDVPACLSRRAARLPLAFDCAYDRTAALSPVAVRAQDDAASGLPVRFLDMNDRICATASCGVVRDGVVMFTDDNHLTASFSRSVAPELGARLARLIGAKQFVWATPGQRTVAKPVQ